MHVQKIIIFLSIGLALIGLPAIIEGAMAPAVWKDKIGEGFRKGAWHAGFSLGGGFGAKLGSGGFHHLLLGTTRVGRMISGVGLQWFCCENLAAILHYRLGHLSNANIKGPNRGINENVLLLGVTWFL